jgi:hypothetical protein
LYILAFALGAGPITGLMVPEINGGPIRGAMCACVFVGERVCRAAEVAGWIHDVMHGFTVEALTLAHIIFIIVVIIQG